MSEIITATVATDDIVVNVKETLLYKGDKGDKGDTGSVENLEVGGRNLLTGTNNGMDKWVIDIKSGSTSKSSKIFDDIGNTNGVRFDISASKSGWGCVQYIDKDIKNILSHSIGKKFSISFDFKSDVSGECVLLVTDSSLLNQMISFGNFNFIANEWKHVKMTGTVINAKVSNQFIYISIANILERAKYIDIANLKLERGEVATDWTPSLEDYENKFNNIIARLEALESK